MKKLYRRVPCGHCEIYNKDKTKGCGCLSCNQTGYVYRPVEVLAEFKARIDKEEVCTSATFGTSVKYKKICFDQDVYRKGTDLIGVGRYVHALILEVKK